MKNVKILVKLRRLIKSVAVYIFLFLFFVAASAFTTSYFGDVKKPVNDSANIDKNGFRTLIVTPYFEPYKPYATQLNPKVIPFVQEYLRRCGEDLEKMKIWGKPYFDMYDGILAQYGLPQELKYLSVIESALIPGVISRAGAVGPWQIMADEARRMGLKITRRTDERKNFYKSTHAAAKILKELNAQFHDWMLVIAAYNCGAGRLRQAIRKSGSRNFWDLQAYLPAETRSHVKRYIGTHYLFEGSGGLTTMTASELADFNIHLADLAQDARINAYGTDEVAEVSGRYRSSVVARSLDMEPTTFNELNPNFDKVLSKGTAYSMLLPKEKMELFKIKRHEILDQSVKELLK